MIAVLFFILSAFAAKPTLTVTTIAQPSFGGVTNTMMYDVTVSYTSVGTTGAHDHDVYVAIGTTPSAASTCASVNGLPTSATGGAWTYNQTYKVATAGSAGTLTFRVYNFEPGVPVYVKAAVGPGGGTWNVDCHTVGGVQGTTIGTPSLPAGLADLNLNVVTSGTVQSKYVLFDTEDCTGTTGTRPMFLVVNPNPGGTPYIAWYLDEEAMTSGGHSTGWRYEKGSGSATGHIVATIDHRYVYDWNFDGSVNYAAIDIGSGTDNCSAGTSDDGPCVGHDAFYSTDTLNTYVITSEPSGIDTTGTGWEYGVASPTPDISCSGTSATFVDDGYTVYGVTNFGTPSGTASWSSDNFLIGDHSTGMGKNRYLPSFGPTYVPNDGEGECFSMYWDHGFEDDVIDWTHVNALAAYKSGATEYLDMSLKEWDQVVRFNTSTGSIAWRLAGGSAPDDLTLSKNGSVTGTNGFADQHDVHTDPSSGYLYMFDNTGDTVSGGSRALRLTLTCSNPGSCTAAEITKSWLVVDPAATSTPLQSLGQGSAEAVGASSMLLLANDHHLIEEFDDTASDGQASHTPNLVINIPGGMYAACDGNGPADRDELNGWYRAYPLATVGEY